MQADEESRIQKNGRPTGNAKNDEGHDTRQSAQTAPPDGLIKLRIPSAGNPQRTLDQLMINLARHPGNYDVLIYPPDGKTIRPRNGMRADASASLLRQMQAILGDGNVKAEEKQG